MKSVNEENNGCIAARTLNGLCNKYLLHRPYNIEWEDIHEMVNYDSGQFSQKHADILKGGATRLVEALRYKPDGHGFDSLWCH